MTELAKALLFTGVTLLIAADALRLYLAPRLHAPRRAWALGLALGGILVIGASLADVLLTLRALLGTVPWARVPEYLTGTVHGQAVIARTGLTLFLLAARVLPGHRVTFPVLALLLLGSVTWTSHAGASGRPLLIAADVLHLGAAALWVGSLLYLAWLPVWTPHGRTALERGLGRLSGLGLAYVGLLTLTGVYASLYHLDSFASLLTTPYGQALAVKLVAVAVALGLAALNRWRFLPAFRAHGATRGLQAVMRLESLVLLLVLLVTGALVSREPPRQHPPDHRADGQPASALLTPELQPRPNVMILGTGPVGVEALPLPEGGFALVLQGDALTASDFTLTRDGAQHTPRADLRSSYAGSDELWLSLPGAPGGRWELLGPAGARFAFILEQAGDLAVFFLPAPSLSGGGLSEVLVYADDQAEAVAPHAVGIRMPGMGHAGDETRIPLVRNPYHHDARAAARRATLAFPMVGAWEVTLHADAEGGAAFSLEVTEE